MTYQDHFTLPTELLEQVAEQGLDFLPELIRIVVNNAMQAEREEHLGVGPYERSIKRRGHSNGFKPKTVTTRIAPITFACAGGASYRGGQLRGVFEYRGIISEKQRKEMNMDGFPNQEYGLLKFLETPSMVIQGCKVTRRQVIKYVANKLGGAHLDTSRGKRKDDAIYSLMDIVLNHYILLDKPAIYFELLSIGQAVICSSDIEKLLTKIGTMK